MPRHPIVSLADVAQKYLALVERSRANLTELYDTGRWKHYYSAPEFVTHARNLERLRELWTHAATCGSNGLPALRREPVRVPHLPVR